jgi:opacity protein-like surface antigen
MKKNLLLFALIIGFASHAQKPQFGLKAGLNIANAALSGDGSPDGKSLAGFHVGLFTDFKLSSKFSFQPELLYSAQGTQFDYVVNFEGVNYDTSSKLKLNYINIPLMMKYYADPKFYLEFGPQIGFLTSADIEVTVLGTTSTQDFKDSMNSTDFGLNFGLGYDVSKKVVLSARYNQGLSNGFNTEPGDNSKLKNNVISFSLGYKFQ